MLTDTDQKLLNTYSNILTAVGAWGEIETFPATEDHPGSIHIHRPFATRTENPMVISQEGGKFLLQDGDGEVVAEGPALADALEPWKGIMLRVPSFPRMPKGR